MRLRVAVPLAVLTGLVVGVPAASAAPAWVTPVSNLTALGPSPTSLQLAVNQRGDVAIAWIDPTTNKVFESDRPAGGQFSTSAAVSSADLTPQGLGSVSIDNNGVVYIFFGANTSSTSSTAKVATRQVGTLPWAVATLSGVNTADPPLTPMGAVTPAGRGIAIWEQGHTAGNEFSKYEFSTKAPGSTTWSAKADIPGAGGGGNVALVPTSPALAIDQSGDAAFVYTRFDNGFNRHIAWGQTFAAGSSTWTNPSAISTDVVGDSVQSSPVVAMDDSGQATAAWTRNNNAPNNIVQFATKALAASSWPAAPSGTNVTPGANDLSPLGSDAGQPAIAVEPDGTTTIAYQVTGVNLQRTRASGASTFAAAAALPTTLTSPGQPVLAAAHPGGGVVAMWTGTGAGQPVIGGASRFGSAGFAPLPNVPGVGNSQAPVIGIDDQDNFPAAWIHTESGQFSVQATAFDQGAPILSNVSFPATAVSGTEFSYSASVTDRWSTVNASWAFGDGATGPLSGTHTYASPGSFLATLTATDAVGNSTQTTKTIQVSPPPPTPTPNPTPKPTPTPPQITSLRLSPTSFKAASSGGSIAAAKTGTTISYRVSQQSRTTFTVLQPARGVKKGKLCVAPPKHKPKGKKLKSCQRFVSKGSFTHTDKAGPVSFRFTGRTRGHKLAPGSYRLQAIGVNAKGKGKAVVAGFKIVKR